MTTADADLIELWDAFHSLVNMNSAELRDWLAAAVETEPVPTPDLIALGHRVYHILGKRRTDLSPDDAATMREVVDWTTTQLATARRDDPAWRHALMAVGHDPLRPDSPQRDELP